MILYYKWKLVCGKQKAAPTNENIERMAGALITACSVGFQVHIAVMVTIKGAVIMGGRPTLWDSLAFPPRPKKISPQNKPPNSSTYNGSISKSSRSSEARNTRVPNDIEL